MLGNQVNEESFNLLHLELHCFRCKINQFSKCWQFELCIFLFFEIIKNKNRKSKLRQVLFRFNLLIATEYNIPELQIMFDEILTVIGHNSGQNWKDYHFPAELNLPWAQVNCRWQRSVYLQMTCLRAFFPFKKEKLFAALCATKVNSYRLAYHFSYIQPQEAVLTS